MPRNGSGTFNPDTVLTPNTTAKASDVNAMGDDLGAEITNSVAVDGQSTMTGPLKLPNGSAGAPSLTFGSDPNTGIFRSAADQLGFTQGGVSILLDTLFPAGVVKDYAGGTVPEGHLLCYGQAVSRATYAKLFTAIGTTYGTGDGSTTFNLPDCQGRVSAGRDDMSGTAAGRLTSTTITGGALALGKVGGAQTHSLSSSENGQHSHSVNDPGHTHDISDPGHAHLLPRGAGGGGGYGLTGLFGIAFDIASAAVATGISIISRGTGISIYDSGSGSAHNNVQPTIIFNKIITTGVLS